MHKKTVNVSVIIPFYNRPEEISACVASLQSLTVYPAEVIIVDDCSKNPLAKEMFHLDVPIQIVRLDRHQGTVIAKNTGIKIATSEYLWFLDSDSIIIKPDCLEKMYEYLIANSHTTGAVGAEGRIIDNILFLNIKSLYPNMDTKASLCPARSVTNHQSLVIGTNNMLTPRSLIQAAGGFMEGLDVAEDKEYSLALHKKGYRTIEDGEFAVNHSISPHGRTSSLFIWELRKGFYCLKCSLLFFPFWKWPLLPFLDLVSKHVYLWYLFRKKRSETSRVSDAPILYKESHVMKLFVFYLTWLCTYGIGIVCLLEAFWLKVYRRNYLSKNYTYTVA